MVAGVRKSQSIADLVKHVNATGTKAGVDIGLTEENCELLVSKLPDAPPPKTFTIKCNVKREHQALVMSPSFWPAGIFVRNFIPPRRVMGVFGDP